MSAKINQHISVSRLPDYVERDNQSEPKFRVASGKMRERKVNEMPRRPLLSLFSRALYERRIARVLYGLTGERGSLWLARGACCGVLLDITQLTTSWRRIKQAQPTRAAGEQDTRE